MADPRIIRVMSSKASAPYDRALYAPLAGRVERVVFPKSFPDDEAALRSALESVDIFHLHWPERFLDPDLITHLWLIEILQDMGVRIVWTQHNLLPHFGRPGWAKIYAEWAMAALGVIHHSEWGMRRASSFRPYRADAIHRVIRLAHWGALRHPDPTWDRRTLSERFGLDPDRCHLGVLGAPRLNKDLGVVARGFLESGREDLELVLFSAGPSAKVPDHPRIHLHRYERVPEEDYNAQLAAIDVLILPYGDGGSMLTSGVVADAIAVSKPVIISDWGYLTETFGDAALNYGIEAEGLSSLLAGLDRSTLEERAYAVGLLRARHDPEEIARQTYELLIDLLSTDRVR